MKTLDHTLTKKESLKNTSTQTVSLIILSERLKLDTAVYRKLNVYLLHCWMVKLVLRF